MTAGVSPPAGGDPPGGFAPRTPQDIFETKKGTTVP